MKKQYVIYLILFLVAIPRLFSQTAQDSIKEIDRSVFISFNDQTQIDNSSRISANIGINIYRNFKNGISIGLGLSTFSAAKREDLSQFEVGNKINMLPLYLIFKSSFYEYRLKPYFELAYGANILAFNKNEFIQSGNYENSVKYSGGTYGRLSFGIVKKLSNKLNMIFQINYVKLDYGEDVVKSYLGTDADGKRFVDYKGAYNIRRNVDVWQGVIGLNF